jgi:hypothetical protein
VTAPDDVALVGFAELSATVVRARLQAAHDRFWDVDTRLLHHPVWFDHLALATGARVVQAVARPGNTAAVAFHTALGAGRHLVQDRAAPGEHQLVLTRSPAR